MLRWKIEKTRSVQNRGREAMAKFGNWLKMSNDSVGVDTNVVREHVIQALRSVYDPEIPVNIYDLGLIYSLDVDNEGKVEVSMTLTAPGCPVAQTFPGTVEEAVKRVDGVADAHVELVWDPPWSQDRMTDEVKLQLGLL